MKVALDGGGILEIPFSIDDISFADFCDFKAKETLFFEALKGDDHDAADAVMILIEVVEQVVKGDLSDIPFAVDGENVLDLMQSDFVFNFDDELSITRIYAHIITLLKRVDIENLDNGKEIRIKNGEHEYVLDSVRAVRLMTETNVTAGEMLETLEFQKRFFGNSEKANLNDVTNLDFELGLTEVAILCRKEGEKLPWRKAEFDNWLQKRIHEIKDIPLSDVLRIRFFLLDSLTNFVQTANTDTFLRGNPIL